MLSIREAVESELKDDYVARVGLGRDVINLSQYARSIASRIEEKTKKAVGVQSIVVALARLQSALGMQKTQTRVNIVQLSVQSPILQLIYLKTDDNLKSLVTAIQTTGSLKDVFFSFSTSTRDIGILVSEKIENDVLAQFAVPPLINKSGLSALSVRFDDKHVSEANVGLHLLERLSSRDIVLDAALTTYNEFTLVFDSKYLQDAIAALSNKE